MLERNVNLLTALLLSAVGLICGMIVAAVALRHFVGSSAKKTPPAPIAAAYLPPAGAAARRRVAPLPDSLPTATVSSAETPPAPAWTEKRHDNGKHKGWNKHNNGKRHDEEGSEGDD